MDARRGIARALEEHLVRRKLMILDEIDAEQYVVRAGPPGGPWDYQGVGTDRNTALGDLVHQFDDQDRGWLPRDTGS